MFVLGSPTPTQRLGGSVSAQGNFLGYFQSLLLWVRQPILNLFIEQCGLFNVSEQNWWNKVVKVIETCFSCSMLCIDGLLLHLVGKRQLLVYSGAPCGNGKLGESIGESHHKSRPQGKHSSQVPVHLVAW